MNSNRSVGASFHVDVERGLDLSSNGTTLLRLHGVLDEFADLEAIPVGDARTVILDLGELRLINSPGIRSWIFWLKTLSGVAGRKFIFRNCTKPVVDQLNAVTGFLPSDATIESFYVPYHCETCEHTQFVLFKAGEMFTPATSDAPLDLKFPTEVLCEKCQATMALDILPSKYFSFLRPRT